MNEGNINRSIYCLMIYYRSSCISCQVFICKPKLAQNHYQMEMHVHYLSVSNLDSGAFVYLQILAFDFFFLCVCKCVFYCGAYKKTAYLYLFKKGPLYIFLYNIVFPCIFFFFTPHTSLLSLPVPLSDRCYFLSVNFCLNECDWMEINLRSDFFVVFSSRLTCVSLFTTLDLFYFLFILNEDF